MPNFPAEKVVIYLIRIVTTQFHKHFFILRAGKYNNLSHMNTIHRLTIIIIFENTYIYIFYKQTDRSLSILFKELKYTIKLFTYWNTHENYLHICTVNEIKYWNMSSSLFLFFLFSFSFLLLKVIDFYSKAQSVDTFSSLHSWVL